MSYKTTFMPKSFYMNANIMKTNFLNVTFMLWRSFVIFFTLRPANRITTLTYVIMDNFCPCFYSDISRIQFWLLCTLNAVNLNNSYELLIHTKDIQITIIQFTTNNTQMAMSENFLNLFLLNLKTPNTRQMQEETVCKT